MSIEPVASGPGLRLATMENGSLWRVTLATPKANILDAAKIQGLTDILHRADRDHTVKVLLIDAEGPHFSFGASVEEHLPGRYESMIPAFDRMCRAILESGVLCLSAVRGQCLGGALELVSLCHRVFASPESRFGQPEIALGVFAPVASAWLAERVGRARAEDICLTGRILSSEEAREMGLVDAIAEDPFAAAIGYAREHFLQRSTSSLRLAVRAIRSGPARRFATDLEHIERLYLEDLMGTHDANEGLRAFLDKRTPRWKNE